LASGITETIKVNVLTMGLSYKFKVAARNSFGFSLFSNEVQILQAEKPSQVSLPVTSTLGNTNVLVKWTAPSDQGSPITRYTILVRQIGGAFGEVSDCNGQDAGVQSSTSCSIPISVLQVTPYSLPWGSSIYVTVIATNAYGDSNDQLPGNGAIILTYPDTPVNLANNAAVTNAY
jgi:hypothetical protein